MIAVELRGRLGNQMFQYAFALAAARRLDTEFVLCAPEQSAPEGELLSTPFTLGERTLPVVEDPGYPRLWIDNQDYDRPEDVLASLSNSTSYGGYFQSYRFFAEVDREVREAFSIRPELDEAFRMQHADILEKAYVCCSVRRAEYRGFIGGSDLPSDYYRDALALVSPPGGTPIVFIGDDLDEVEQELGDIEGARFEPNEPFVDFQLLLHARAAIIPNSSFAWWGAWLADADTVVAPKYWLGWRHRAGWHRHPSATDSPRRTRRTWEYPRGILPPQWRQVPVGRPWRERLAPWSIKSSAALLANNVRAAVGTR
jgi:hypothetical protein